MTSHARDRDGRASGAFPQEVPLCLGAESMLSATEASGVLRNMMLPMTMPPSRSPPVIRAKVMELWYDIGKVRRFEAKAAHVSSEGS